MELTELKLELVALVGPALVAQWFVVDVVLFLNSQLMHTSWPSPDNLSVDAPTVYISNKWAAVPSL